MKPRLWGWGPANKQNKTQHFCYPHVVACVKQIRAEKNQRISRSELHKTCTLIVLRNRSLDTEIFLRKEKRSKMLIVRCRHLGAEDITT